MEGLPGGTVTFLFTDVEGSTRLHEERRDAPAILAGHLQLLGEAVARHGGVVFASGGDGLAAAFRTAGKAVAAALEGQAAMVRLPVLVRMGLHTGEAEPVGNDYQSPVVNRAARVMAAAHGGQLVASEATVALLNSDPHGPAVHELGRHRLRDVPEPIALFQIDRAGSPAERFPPPRTMDRLVGHLPASVSSFVGRDDELRHLADVVRAERMVTVTGPGGVGKTRISLEAAAHVAASFPGGVWFVELAPVGDPDAVATAVASVLEIASQGASAIDAIAEHLASGSSLLILDNCEHVVDAVAELVDVVLSRCRGGHLLATSREAIGVSGERVVPLRPMATEAAVTLFDERARALDPTFDLAAETLATSELVARLDGIPLAIELAAARTTTMSVGELLGRLDSRLKLLAGGRRRTVERHATMRATLDWSHDLLTDGERRLLRRLGVFPSSFTVAAVERLDDVAEVEAVGDVTDVLGGLVRKSLVQALPASRRHRRFRLLETVRAYALERLAESGETEAIGRGHADWILACYQRMGLTESMALVAVEHMHELIELRHDVRAAIDWCLAGDDIGRAVALAAPHPRAASNVLDAVTWADAVLAAGSAVADRDRFVLHIVAAEGKMLHAVQPSAAYPDIEAAVAIGAGDEAQAVMLRRVLALQSWMRERDSDAMVAHANAEGSSHPADNALDHFSAALLLGLADRDPRQHLSRGDALLTGCGRTNVFRAVPVAAVAHWLARRGRDDAVPLFLEAMAEARSLPPGPIRSIVAALASGGLASLDPASARQVLLELIDPDRGDLVSPSDIVRAAIGTVLYLDATGRPDDRSEILSRTLFLPGAPRLVDVFAPEVDTDVSLLPGTHLELLDRMRTFLLQPPSTHEVLPVN